MDSLNKLQEITLRLDNLEETGEWLARAHVNNDKVTSQTGSLVSVIAEDIREKLLELVSELEREIVVTKEYH